MSDIVQNEEPKNFRDLTFFIRTSTSYQTSGECTLYFDGYRVKFYSYSDRISVLKQTLDQNFGSIPTYVFDTLEEFDIFEVFKDTKWYDLLIRSLDGNPDSSWMDEIKLEKDEDCKNQYTLSYKLTNSSPYLNGWCYCVSEASISVNQFSDEIKIEFGDNKLTTNYRELFAAIKLYTQLRDNGFNISADTMSFKFGDENE